MGRYGSFAEYAILFIFYLITIFILFHFILFKIKAEIVTKGGMGKRVGGGVMLRINIDILEEEKT